MMAALVLFLAATAQGPPLASVSFPSGNETVSARWVAPDQGGPFPAVILVHERWGLNDWIERKAQALAGDGYLALAVDLYRGKSTADPGEAEQWKGSLPEERAMRDLGAAMDFLRRQPSVIPARIGVVGWGMGGGYALKLVAARSDLAACAVYYGNLPTQPSALARITCPVLGFFGTEDVVVPPAAVQQFESSMKQLGGKDVFVKIYDRTGHAFMDDQRISYGRAAAVDSWKRTLTFFSNHLKPSSE